MPDIQDLFPYGDIDEDYAFVVRCDDTISHQQVSSMSMRFLFRGPYRRWDRGPQTWVDASGGHQCMVTDLRHKEITCAVTGHILPSGEYRGVLRRTDTWSRATLARWTVQVREDVTR